MRYFCERCDGKSPEEMMRIAMSTVESEYTVVGVLEMFNSSLAVFQEYLPGRSTSKCCEFSWLTTSSELVLWRKIPSFLFEYKYYIKRLSGKNFDLCFTANQLSLSESFRI